LDGLRGIAILLVFFFHYLPHNPHDPFSWVAGIGWSGVDLFFVLSGFLITGILYDTRQSNNFFRVFYARRALRLFPIYVLAVGLVLITVLLLRANLTWRFIPFFIYGANLVLPTKGGAPDFTPYLNCVHFWSLAVEEQFYSLWPIVVFLVPKRTTLMKICVVGILGALAFRLVMIRLDASTWVLYTELPSRMDALLSGGLLALGLRSPHPNGWQLRRRFFGLMIFFSLILVILFLRAKSLFLASSQMTSWGYTAFAGLYFSLIGLALIPGTIPNRVGKHPVLCFFGRYSYGLYIWHDLPSPICVGWLTWFTNKIHPLILAEWAYSVAMLMLFTAVAVASYQLIEVRFLRLKSRFVYSESQAT
jgi:peptidoglycan/LPS O-acetylase OafA/YrhL